MISTNDLSRIRHEVVNGNRIIGPDARRRPLTAPDGERARDIRIGDARTHNGAIPGPAGRSLRASVVVMPDGYVAAMAWNSSGVVGDRMIDRAFEANRR